VAGEAATEEEAYQLAEAEAYEPDTDTGTQYFSFAGDGMSACTYRHCQEITRQQMAFLERVGLAYRR
jgi:hypothetical protein